MQGDPLRWFVMVTPRLVSTRHRCRFISSEAHVTFRPFCAVIPLCAHALDDPEDKLRIPSSNISHVRFFISISPERAWKFYYPAHREIGSSDDIADCRYVA